MSAALDFFAGRIADLERAALATPPRVTWRAHRDGCLCGQCDGEGFVTGSVRDLAEEIVAREDDARTFARERGMTSTDTTLLLAAITDLETHECDVCGEVYRAPADERAPHRCDRHDVEDT